MIHAAAERDWRRVRRVARRLEGVRYERQLAELISDERLVSRLCTVLPEAYRHLPLVPEPIRTDVGALAAEVRHSMYQQELEIARHGGARRATPDQERRLLEAAQQMLEHTAWLRTWRGRLRMTILVHRPW